MIQFNWCTKLTANLSNVHYNLRRLPFFFIEFFGQFRNGFSILNFVVNYPASIALKEMKFQNGGCSGLPLLRTFLIFAPLFVIGRCYITYNLSQCMDYYTKKIEIESLFFEVSAFKQRNKLFSFIFCIDYHDNFRRYFISFSSVIEEISHENTN